MAVAFDPTDPRHLTPEQRLDELTTLLAAGVRRAIALRALAPPPAPPSRQIPPESEQIPLDDRAEKSVHADAARLTQAEGGEGVEP